MNSYLITDMPGTCRFTCVDRAISFYSELCTELLAFARDGDDWDIESNLTDDEVHVLRSFSQAFRKYDASVPTTEINKRSLLQQWKTKDLKALKKRVVEDTKTINNFLGVVKVITNSKR